MIERKDDMYRNKAYAHEPLFRYYWESVEDFEKWAEAISKDMRETLTNVNGSFVCLGFEAHTYEEYGDCYGQIGLEFEYTSQETDEEYEKRKLMYQLEQDQDRITKELLGLGYVDWIARDESMHKAYLEGRIK